MTRKFNNHTSEDIAATLTGGLLVMLGFAFLILKIFQVVSWSWWIVLLPFWSPILLGIVLLTICIIIVMLSPSDK
jgi:membrane protein YdbS with pleckstrin-like domain